MTEVQIPEPFRKQGQLIAFDGCTRAQADYFVSSQLKQYGEDREKALLQLITTFVKSIKLDRHDWEDWPTDSREAFVKLNERVK